MRLSFDALANYRGLVTLVDGAFDPLHPGHLAYFRAARSFGYPLLCHVCPDSYTAQKHPVLLPASDRADLLHALDLITYTHQEDRSTLDVLHQLRPAFYVKGADWATRLPPAQVLLCAALGIRIRYTETVTHSSSALLRALQPDVDAFEKLVQSQKPASEPWTPTEAVPYDFESRKAAEGRHPQLICDHLIDCEDAEVLDYGCGPGHLVRMLKDIQVKERTQVGVRGHDIVQRHEPWHITADELDARGRVWDLIICREVAEHGTIQEIAGLVRRLCSLSAGKIYLTTRFKTNPQHFLDFDTSDTLDPSHISIMPMPWLRHLFTLHGFTRRADLEQRLDWKQLGRCLVYERPA
jgi:cytidyltransferase-like protein